MSDAVHVTRPLLSVLCELAADADPKPITVSLVATRAADLEPMADEGSAGVTGATGTNANEQSAIPLAEIDLGTPVFSDFYFPGAGDAVNRVFGVDLGTPAGQTQGRFLSHPKGDPGVSLTDDLHARLLVAVPPWDLENVRAYDRNGRRLDLVVVAAGTPEE